MYCEEVRLPPRRIALFAAPVAVALVLLVVALVFAPLPRAARLVIGVGGMLYLVAGALWVASMSRVRVALDAGALAVALRFLVARRYALERIAACAPINAPVWGITYRRWGMPFRPQAGGGSAVLLRLTDGAQVAFPSADPESLCAALRAQRPAIADAATQPAPGRPGAGAPPGSWRAAAEAESREWMVRCPRCGYEQSAWDLGWTIWKAAGNSRKYRRCPECGRSSWHTVYRQRTGSAPPPGD